MHLHHNLGLHLHVPRVPWAYDVQVPLRKMVDCRTRDLHQSLLVKLNRALVRQGKDPSMALEAARFIRPFPHHPSLEGTGKPHGLLQGHLTVVMLGQPAQPVTLSIVPTLTTMLILWAATYGRQA